MNSRLPWALTVSIVAHVVIISAILVIQLLYPAFLMRNIEFVEADYNRAILWKLEKPLIFYAPTGAFAPDGNSPASGSGPKAKEEPPQQAREEPPPPPPPANPDTPPGGYGLINTAPIKDQISILYEARKTGSLNLPDGKLKVGVAGEIEPDGTIKDGRISVSSNNPEIDSAALAILAALSESHALGPLHELDSLSVVLEMDQHVELKIVGNAANSSAAATIVTLAKAALLFARLRKAEDPSAMILLNNFKVSYSGARVEGIIRMEREAARNAMATAFESKP